jgi:hypothetical protein
MAVVLSARGRLLCGWEFGVHDPSKGPKHTTDKSTAGKRMRFDKPR